MYFEAIFTLHQNWATDTKRRIHVYYTRYICPGSPRCALYIYIQTLYNYYKLMTVFNVLSKNSLFGRRYLRHGCHSPRYHPWSTCSTSQSSVGPQQQLLIQNILHDLCFFCCIKSQTKKIEPWFQTLLFC